MLKKLTLIFICSGAEVYMLKQLRRGVVIFHDMSVVKDFRLHYCNGFSMGLISAIKTNVYL